MNPKNRREFLKNICAVGAAGAHLTKLGLVSANAQTTSNYKALVCVFLYGGNDSNNTIIPIDSRYGAYAAMRSGLALPANTLLPAGNTGYAFHPRLTNIQRLYNQNRAAMVMNVGMLSQPTTRDTMKTVPLPRNLYSHDDQVLQWQTSDPLGGSSGWAGRLNEQMGAQNTGIIPPGISLIGGNAVFLSSPGTASTNFGGGNSSLATFGGGGANTVRRDALQRVITFDSGVQLVGAANGVLTSSIDYAREFNSALASAPPVLPVAFPSGDLANQLAQVIRLMAVRDNLGMNRQIFFAGLVGFDNHEGQLPQHDSLMTQVDGAIGAFFANLEALGLTNNVTLFTESEFNRTGNINSVAGSDHAWGGHHLVMGGAVKPGVYGTFPKHEVRGPDDANDRGYWIPTTSLDQYAATLGGWFGVPDSGLGQIFPNLGNFSAQNLGFL